LNIRRFVVFAHAAIAAADATFTLARRVLRRERVWQAHRAHYYRRMVRSGLGHRGTAYVAYAVMVVCAGAALVAMPRP